VYSVVLQIETHWPNISDVTVLLLVGRLKDEQRLGCFSC